MSCFEPRAITDNYGIGEVDYEDLILHSPIPKRGEGDIWQDGIPMNPSRVRNKSLKHLES